MTDQQDEIASGPSLGALLNQAAITIRRLETALTRQTENMAFVLNHGDVRSWYAKFSAELTEDRAALKAGNQSPFAPRFVRHKKSGGIYEVLGRAKAQVSTGEDGKPTGLGLVRQRYLIEGYDITVYRCPLRGLMFCRFPDEFEDGRFEDIPPKENTDG